jgi:hypothetical protein
MAQRLQQRIVLCVSYHVEKCTFASVSLRRSNFAAKIKRMVGPGRRFSNFSRFGGGRIGQTLSFSLIHGETIKATGTLGMVAQQSFIQRRHSTRFAILQGDQE